MNGHKQKTLLRNTSCPSAHPLPTEPQKPAFPPPVVTRSFPKQPSLTEPASRHLKPGWCEGSEHSPSLGGHSWRWLSEERRWHGLWEPWPPLHAWGLLGKASPLGPVMTGRWCCVKAVPREEVCEGEGLLKPDFSDFFNVVGDGIPGKND